jgi:hypothetical protein
MFAFSPLEAAITGIGFAIRRPIWTLRFIAFASALTFCYAQLSRHLQVPVLTGALVLIAVMVMVSAIVNAALLRKLIRDEDGGLFTLQLGFDELRLAIVIGAIAGGLAIVAISGAILSVTAVVRVSDMAVQWFGPDAKWPSVWIMGSACGLTTLAFVAYFGVRLSLSPAATIGRETIGIAASWELTRDHVADLFKAYLISFALVLLTLAALTSTALIVWGLLVKTGLAPTALTLGGIGQALKSYIVHDAFGSAKLAGAAAVPLIAAQAFANAIGTIIPAGVGANAYLAFCQPQDV